MTKKFLIPLVLIGVVFATGLGIFIASSQSAQPSTSTTESPKNELTIKEIERTVTLPDALGKVTYSVNSPTSILIYSKSYENLQGCPGKHITELQLAGTPDASTPVPEKAIAISGQYKYALVVTQPLGECGGDKGKQLAAALQTALADAR